jgi:hypothetical protein
MDCPLCKTLAGIDKNEIVKKQDGKVWHKVTYVCRYPKCDNFKKECATKEYVDDSP